MPILSHEAVLPLFYELRYSKQALHLDIDGSIWPRMRIQLHRESQGRLQADISGINLGDFIPPKTGYWGYNKCVLATAHPSRPKWLRFSLTLPKVKPLDDTSFTLIAQVSGTLKVLLEVLSWDIELPPEIPSVTRQLVTIESMGLRQASNGASIKASTVLNFAAFLDDSAYLQATNAMREVASLLYSFLADTTSLARSRGDNTFILQCPGNAAGMYAESSYADFETYEYSCSNVDGPGQQLILLSGLASLSQTVTERYFQTA